jgi:prepilin-type N-terminal cleavage/methylation domain-containing protein
MKAVPKSLKNSKGFSLIEVIVVITVASVLFAMMFSYFGTSLLDSAQPVVRLNQTLGLTQTAERITEHYRQNPTGNWNLLILKIYLTYYPSRYGQNYSLVTNKFIKFVNGMDVTATGWDTRDKLKVQIQQDQTHETITLLFTKQ